MKVSRHFCAVKLIEENCKGCTQCMNKCPMEAIRLKNSKAIIYEDKCINCGECIRTCPYNGYEPVRNKLSDVKSYKVKVAIPSVTLFSQFGDFVEPFIINNAIRGLGFDEVFDITYACDINYEITRKEMEKVEKPAIGILCPSIERLIKNNYPNLLSNVIRVLTPIEISACLIREKYRTEGYEDEEIGIFYLSPCISWNTLAESSEFKEKMKINGIILISDIYSQLLKNIQKETLLKEDCMDMSYTGLAWAYSGGVSKAMNIKEYIDVDGLENVKRVFNDIENGKMKDLEFVEAYACSGGCLGGVALIENPYNAKRITKKYKDYIKTTYAVEKISDYYREKFSGNIRKLELSNQKLADDFLSAVKKMKYMNEIINMLPGTDCGQCGSPSCKAFAEDVARGLAVLDECKMITRRNIDEG